MKPYELTYRPFGENAILIEWPQFISEEILLEIVHFNHAIETELPEMVKETVMAYNSLTVFVNEALDLLQVIGDLKTLKKSHNNCQAITTVTWEIPVCYEEEFALDLNEMADALLLDPKEIISIHSQPRYILYFIGFLPGFMYLGGLDERIHFPRRASPRSLIDRGAVGIGGQQTGVYPKSSPAGWNIIGNSPVDFFDVMHDVPCFAKPGDSIQFNPITYEEHVEFTHDVAFGRFNPESLKINV